MEKQLNQKRKTEFSVKIERKRKSKPILKRYWMASFMDAEKLYLLAKLSTRFQHKQNIIKKY